MNKIEKDIIPYNASSPQRPVRTKSYSSISERNSRSHKDSLNVSKATSRWHEASPTTPNRTRAISRASLGRSAEKPMTSVNRSVNESLDRGYRDPSVSRVYQDNSISMVSDYAPRVSEVSDEVKQRVVYWFEELNLVHKNASSLEDFPAKIYSGALLCELVNRLEGKSADQIKGINMYPKNFTATKANVNKAL